MAVSNSVLTVATSATQVTPAISGTVHINNSSANDIHLGDDSVTTSNGYPLTAGSETSITLSGDALYAIAGTESDVRVLVTG